jgi:hypothetical protein
VISIRDNVDRKDVVEGKKYLKLFHRIYNDNLQPSRLGEYDNLLKLFSDHGFISLPIIAFYDVLKTKSLNANEKYLILRHDIDSDTEMAQQLFDIERKYGARSSFYFRLSTLRFDLMKEINRFGSEASYHFEEVATYCKKHHIKERSKVIQELPNIKEMFSSNFQMIESKLETKLRSVCSHGDFANRKLKYLNWELTKDYALRERLGIEVETYDKILMDNFDIYISDEPYPTLWGPANPVEFVNSCNTVCIMTHPRNWGRNIVTNIKLNLTRVVEGFFW